MSSKIPSSKDKDTILSIGQQCSAPSCMLVDFLPFRCQHCQNPFCGEHFLPTGHNCPDYAESKHNRVAPSCPLCNEIVAIPPGQDPNIRMEQHISTQCSVMTGKSGKAKSGPTCAKARCGKVLFAPICCEKCREQFCPQHRFPIDHNCKAPALAPAVPTGGMSVAKANALAKFNSRFNPKSATSSTTAKATKKPSASAPSNASSSDSTSQASTSTPKASNLPFSATNRDTHSILSNHTGTDTDTVNANLTLTGPSSADPPNTSAHKPPVIDPMSFVPRSAFARA